MYTLSPNQTLMTPNLKFIAMGVNSFRHLFAATIKNFENGKKRETIFVFIPECFIYVYISLSYKFFFKYFTCVNVSVVIV